MRTLRDFLLICAVVAIAAFTVGAVSRAEAHAHLAAASPKADSSVAAAPAALTLTFSEALEPSFTKVKVTGPDGSTVAVDKPTLDPAATLVTVPFTGKLAPGTYKVDWHVVSVDGHKSEGSYSFTVKP
jgi:methionine-rich copper-binding protein CopC